MGVFYIVDFHSALTWPGWEQAEWKYTIFDYVVRPSRLVLGKKFFWIWFIYTLEGCVLVLHYFILTKCHLWNTLVTVDSIRNSCDPVVFLGQEENDRKWEWQEQRRRRRRWNLISWSWFLPDRAVCSIGLFIDYGKWIIPDKNRRNY